MLKQRILTALILIPCVLFILYSRINWLFYSTSLILLFALGLEYSKLIPIHNIFGKIVYIFGLFLLPCLGLYFSENILFSKFFYGLLILNSFIWMGIVIALRQDPTTKCWWSNTVIVFSISFIVLPVFLMSLLSLYNIPNGINSLLYVLLIVWATDIGAYIAGKTFGSNKMIPWISPGKTWEGTLGGICCALLIVLVGYFIFKPNSMMYWFISGLITIFMAIVGDLFISMLKRRCHLKDTGAIFPGHGGVLDRLDSLLSALPFFFLIYICSATSLFGI